MNFWIQICVFLIYLIRLEVKAMRKRRPVIGCLEGETKSFLKLMRANLNLVLINCKYHLEFT